MSDDKSLVMYAHGRRLSSGQRWITVTLSYTLIEGFIDNEAICIDAVSGHKKTRRNVYGTTRLLMLLFYVPGDIGTVS